MHNTNLQIKNKTSFLKTENLLYATDIVTKQNNSNQDKVKDKVTTFLSKTLEI